MKYLKKVQAHLSGKDEGKEIIINHIPREKNIMADLLSKLVITNLVKLSFEVWIEILEKPSIKKGQ
jgi:uncharacterized protein YwgA